MTQFLLPEVSHDPSSSEEEQKTSLINQYINYQTKRASFEAVIETQRSANIAITQYKAAQANRDTRLNDRLSALRAMQRQQDTTGRSAHQNEPSEPDNKPQVKKSGPR